MGRRITKRGAHRQPSDLRIGRAHIRHDLHNELYQLYEIKHQQQHLNLLKHLCAMKQLYCQLLNFLILLPLFYILFELKKKHV